MNQNKEKEVINENKINNKLDQNINLNNNNTTDNIYFSFAKNNSDIKNEKNKEINKEINKEKTLMDDLKAKLKERNEKKKMNEENNINKNEGIYKSNDLERIIKQHKNEQTKANIKKPDSNINTIFDSIENDYNLSEEENNNSKCDRNFSFGKKFSGTFGKEEKNENNIENNKQIILNDNKKIKLE